MRRSGLDPGVWRGDVWGSRLAKYQATADGSVANFSWEKLNIAGPQYLFKSLGPNKTNAAYSKYWAVPNIIHDNTPGIITARDHFSIAFSPAELERRVSKLVGTTETDQELREEYRLDDTRGWSLTDARAALREPPNWKKSIRPLLQAPFDSRFVPHDIRLIDWGRWRFIARLKQDTVGICLPRKIDIQRPWEHAFVAAELISHHAVSMKEVNYFFPAIVDNKENLSADFRSFLDGRYEPHYTVQEIFGYIYAVLYAPTYRARYAQFLRIDFPRIPFPEKAEDFEALSELGWELVEAHLLRHVPHKGLAKYPSQGDHVVEFVRYSPKDQAISINDTQSFKAVPQAVWDFHIGGYQVLDKYLKSRKGRKLSLGEIEHFATVADSLAFTIEQMAKIDKAYQNAFAQRG